MAQRVVARVNAIARHFLAAAQTGICAFQFHFQTGLLAPRIFQRHVFEQRRQHRIAPGVGAGPVIGIAVVIEEIGFMLPRYRLVRLAAGTVLDLLARQADVQHRVMPVYAGDRNRRDQHLAPREPLAGIDHEVADHPFFIVEIDVVDTADIAVERSDLHAFEFFCTMQHVSLLQD
ncbi:hypothetical protein D9M68_860540 [compost metagenome]